MNILPDHVQCIYISLPNLCSYYAHTVLQVIEDHIMCIMHLILWGVLQYSTVWKYPPLFNNLPQWGI